MIEASTGAFLAACLAAQTWTTWYLRSSLTRRGATRVLETAIWLLPGATLVLTVGAALGFTPAIWAALPAVPLALAILFPDAAIALAGGPRADVRIARTAARVRQLSLELEHLRDSRKEMYQVAAILRLLDRMVEESPADLAPFVENYVGVIRAWLDGESMADFADRLAQIDAQQAHLADTLRRRGVDLTLLDRPS